MESPLYVLAMSADSELKTIEKAQEKSQTENNASPPDHANDFSSSTPRATKTVSPDTEVFIPQDFNPTKNRMMGGYMPSPTPKALVTPLEKGSKVLRVATSSSRHPFAPRLDPFAIELIETGLLKGFHILSRPFFPYTFESEPLRCWEIRTHLLRRFAVLPPDADENTLITATDNFLRLWGYKLVFMYYRGDHVPGFSPPPPMMMMAATKKGQPDHMLRLVSPLKRPTRRDFEPQRLDSPAYDDGDEKAFGLRPFLVDEQGINDSFFVYNGKEDPRRGRVMALAGTKEKPLPEHRLVSNKGAFNRSTVSTEKSSSLVKEKKKRTVKRGPTPVAKNKKTAAKIGTGGANKLKGLLRRWTQQEKDLYLYYLDAYGVGVTDKVHGVMPEKSYGQLHHLSVTLQQQFGVKVGSKVTDEIRECFK